MSQPPVEQPAAGSTRERRGARLIVALAAVVVLAAGGAAAAGWLGDDGRFASEPQLPDDLCTYVDVELLRSMADGDLVQAHPGLTFELDDKNAVEVNCRVGLNEPGRALANLKVRAIAFEDGDEAATGWYSRWAECARSEAERDPFWESVDEVPGPTGLTCVHIATQDHSDNWAPVLTDTHDAIYQIIAQRGAVVVDVQLRVAHTDRSWAIAELAPVAGAVLDEILAGLYPS